MVLVPVFMIWLARYCEKMTKKAVAKEQEEQQQQQQQQQKINVTTISNVSNNQPSMAGFLNK